MPRFLLILLALASTTVHASDAPAMVCRAGISGGADVSRYAEQLEATTAQVPADGNKLQCGDYLVLHTPGMLATSRKDGSQLIRSRTNGTIDGVSSDQCLTITEAQANQIERLDACQGVTPPALRPIGVVTRHLPEEDAPEPPPSRQ